jgi:hypothetical protein
MTSFRTPTRFAFFGHRSYFYYDIAEFADIGDIAPCKLLNKKHSTRVNTFSIKNWAFCKLRYYSLVYSINFIHVELLLVFMIHNLWDVFFRNRTKSLEYRYLFWSFNSFQILIFCVNFYAKLIQQWVPLGKYEIFFIL